MDCDPKDAYCNPIVKRLETAIVILSVYRVQRYNFF